MSIDHPPPFRPGMAAFIPRCGGRPASPPHQGAGVRFVTCDCGAEFMAVQGQAEACVRCGKRADDQPTGGHP